MQLLSDEDIFMHSIFFHDFSMVCEGNDDIEIMSNEYHVFIQVKSSNPIKVIPISRNTLTKSV